MEGVPTKILGRATSVKRLLLHDSSHILEILKKFFFLSARLKGQFFFVYFSGHPYRCVFSYPAASPLVMAVDTTGMVCSKVIFT